MSAIEIRAELARGGDFYLVPLAKVGEVPKLYAQWVSQIVSGTQSAILVYNTAGEESSTELIAAGYQLTRSQQTLLPSGEPYRWTERVLVVRSLAEAKKQFATLSRNIEAAIKALNALTPEPGRGRRQIRTEKQLVEKAEQILVSHGVKPYLRYAFVREEHTTTQYVGPGRGRANRPKRQIRRVRYQITKVTKDEAAISTVFCQMGWKLYATNQPQEKLSFDEAVRLYRAAPRIERHFHLFKDTPIGISPMYVGKDDPIKGLARLLSLSVRLMTLIEIVTRRHLAQHQTTLVGLYEANPNRKTNQPTAVRLLRAFRGVSRVRLATANKDSPYTTPLTDLQRQILSILGISDTIYQMPLHRRGTLESLGRRCGQILAQISHRFARV